MTTIPRSVLQGMGLMAAGETVALLGGTGWIATIGSVVFVLGGFRIASYLSTSPAAHWRFVNILLRIVGLAFSFAGLGVVWSTVTHRLHPKSGSPILDTLVGTAFVAIGLFLLKRPARRPDLGDPLLSDRTMQIVRGLPRNWGRPPVPGREARQWWTGDTKTPQREL